MSNIKNVSYKIVKGRDDKVEKEVNELIDKGYAPLGQLIYLHTAHEGPCAGMSYFVQAMIFKG